MSDITVLNDIVEEKVCVGQYYKPDYVGETDIFVVSAIAPNEYCLISLITGQAWTEPRKNINAVFDKERDNFTLIPEGGTLTINVSYK